MVIFGTARFTWPATKRKSSTITGLLQPIRPLTRSASGSGSPPLNWTFCSGSYSSTPSSPDTKSKCQ